MVMFAVQIVVIDLEAVIAKHQDFGQSVLRPGLADR
jgi:hypothetical protein